MENPWNLWLLIVLMNIGLMISGIGHGFDLLITILLCHYYQLRLSVSDVFTDIQELIMLDLVVAYFPSIKVWRFLGKRYIYDIDKGQVLGKKLLLILKNDNSASNSICCITRGKSLVDFKEWKKCLYPFAPSHH